MTSPVVTSFFDDRTKTVTHVVRDPDSNIAAIVDPVLDYDIASGRKFTESADRVLEYVKKEGLEIEWLLETHVHADHLTAAPYMRERLGGGKIAVGKRVSEVQKTWTSIFNYKPEFAPDPSIFDHLFEDGETFRIGGLEGRVMFTPGHTAMDVTYIIGDAAFIGDTLFSPDYGTARADFPGGDARALYRSIQKILALPDETRLYLCHDYLPKEGRTEHLYMTTVAEEKKNVMVAGLNEDEFVRLRESRDKELATPLLLYPSLQVNIRAGQMPPPEDNGVSYMKTPIRDGK